MSIYSEVLACEEMLNQEFDALTGEVTSENEANQEILNTWKAEIIEQGIENLCKVRANKLAEIEALKAEKKRIADKQAIQEKKLERLEGYIQLIYEKDGSPKLQAGTFTVSTRKSESVVFDDTFVGSEYLGTFEFKPDKKLIKEKLKAGEVIKGASIQENVNLQIK